MISAYALVFGGFLLLGKADLVGKRRIACSASACSSSAHYYATSLGRRALVAARAVQGWGGDRLPTALSILMATLTATASIIG